MDKVYSKLVLHITVLPETDQTARFFVDDIYAHLKNTLTRYKKMPNVKSLCEYCDSVGGNKLANDIRNQFDHLIEKDTFFHSQRYETSMAYFSNIDGSNKKNIRILLYPGNRDNISNLSMDETTHNMIIQYTRNGKAFFPTERHTNPPSFYQKCSSMETALCYLEALLIDSCLCHYLGISDVATKHDQKQKISRDKIDFLMELARGENFKELTFETRKLITYVISKIDPYTPYISFFSIFSVAAKDVSKSPRIEPYFEDFFKLFELFQKWYFEKNGRLFHKDSKIHDAVKSIFRRSPFQGQIRSTSLDVMIQDKCEKISKGLLAIPPNPPFEVEHRWAIVIIKHMPSNEDEIKIFRSLFSGPIHQATVTIIPWNELNQYDMIRHRIEIVPILISS